MDNIYDRYIHNFHGLANFYRRLIQNFNIIMAPITNCSKQNKFSWGTEQHTFEEIKKHILNPILIILDFEISF